MKLIFRLLQISLAITSIVSVLGVIYGFIVERLFTLQYAFQANIFIGAIIIGTGIFLYFLPDYIVRMSDRLIESQGVFSKRGLKVREKRKASGYATLWIGIFNMIIVGVVEIVMWLIINSS